MFHAEVNPAELSRLQLYFKSMPRNIKKEIKKGWNKDGTRIKKIIQSSAFSRTGPSSVGRGSAREYGHLKSSFIRIVKVSSKNSFGAFMRLKYKGPKQMGKRFIGRFHEFGTGHGPRTAKTQGMQGRRLPARALVETGWNKAEKSVDMVKVTLNAIDRAMKS